MILSLKKGKLYLKKKKKEKPYYIFIFVIHSKFNDYFVTGSKFNNNFYYLSGNKYLEVHVAFLLYKTLYK